MDYEQLGHILESIHPGVTIADSSGVFRFVSNSYLSGRSVKGSDIIGKFAGSEEMMKMFSPCVTQWFLKATSVSQQCKKALTMTKLSSREYRYSRTEGLR